MSGSNSGDVDSNHKALFPLSPTCQTFEIGQAPHYGDVLQLPQLMDLLDFANRRLPTIWNMEGICDKTQYYLNYKNREIFCLMMSILQVRLNEAFLNTIPNTQCSLGDLVSFTGNDTFEIFRFLCDKIFMPKETNQKVLVDGNSKFIIETTARGDFKISGGHSNLSESNIIFTEVIIYIICLPQAFHSINGRDGLR